MVWLLAPLTGESLLAKSVYRDFVIGIGEHEFEVNLIILDIRDSMLFWA